MYKKIPISIASMMLLSLFFTSVHAQHWQDSTVAVPESVFPIGGIPFGLGDFHDSVNSLKEAGFNFDYERGNDYGIIANFKAMTHGLVGFMSMSQLTNYTGAYYGGFFPGAERRFFLASNDSGIYAQHETGNNWKNKAGSINANNEWKIPKTSGLSYDSNYVLDSLQVDPNSLAGFSGSYITYPQTDSAICDFIFRIDTTALSSSLWNNPALSVEYYLIDNSNNVTTFFDTITVNKQLAFLQASNRDQIEHRHIVSFPKQSGTPFGTLTPFYYARIRQVLPIHANSIPIKTLRVKVRTFKLANVLIRGLRIRTQFAEQVLTGQMDSTLDTLFRAIRDTLNNEGLFNSTPFITAGGETQTPNFRVYSYVDDRMNKKIGKHLVMFLTDDGTYIHFPFYRSIYEDQTDSVPPPLQAECLATFYGYAGEIVPVPRDCIPDSIFNLPGFTMLGAQVLPVADSSYTHYTNVYQSKSGWCSKFEASQTAFPPGKTPGKWYGMLSGLLSTDLNPTSINVSAGHPAATLRDTIIAKLKRGDCNAIGELYRADQLFDSGQLQLSYRVPFRTEMRADGWDAIAFGAKGIYWNALGNDHGENVGITDNGLKRDKDFDSTSQISGGFLTCDSELYTGFVVYDSILNQQIVIAKSDSGNMTHRSRIIIGGSWVRAFKEAFDNGCPIWCAISSNCATWGIGVWAPTFYGFRERWNAAKRFSQDIIPIAPTLSSLDWQDAFFYDERFAGAYTHTTSTRVMDSMRALSAWSKFPLLEVKTNKINRYVTPLSPLNQYDSANATLVELGLFTSKIDSLAKYIVVANHRTWALYYKANGTIDSSQGRMGAIDARQVEMKFDMSKFDTSIHVLRVTNMRTNTDAIVFTDSIYKIILEPGEGTLLRVAPALGLDLGRMTENAFNNGRHIAGVDSSEFGVKRYLTTYARNGEIVVSYPVETPTTNTKRNTDTPADSIIDNSGNCHNPSIAYNHRTNRIGLTYRRFFAACDTCHWDTTFICYRNSSFTSPYNFSALAVLDTLFTWSASGEYISPPAIAPRDTATPGTITNGEFWVAYNHPDSGGSLVLVDPSSNVLKKKFFWAPDNYKNYVKYISIATHVPYDSVHISFEEGIGNDGQIFYTKGYLDNNSGLQVVTNPALGISFPLNSCQSHNTQIAIMPDNTIDVVWESLWVDSLGSNVEGKSATIWHYAVLRSRNNGGWSDFTTFLARTVTEDVAYLNAHKYLDRIYVNISSAFAVVRDDPHTPTWRDWRRITWSNLDNGQISIARYGLSDGYALSFWNRYSFLEPSQEPAMPNLSFGDLVAQPFLYRGIPDHQEDGLFDARIIRFNFPSNPIFSQGRQYQILKAFPIGGPACQALMKAKIGNVQIQSVSPDTIRSIPLRGLADSATDPNGNKPVQWDDKKGVRSLTFHISSGDTLEYQRDFQVGAYQVGDTATVASYLNGSTDYLRARIYLRRATNDSILAILDSARLKQSGFVQSGSLLDTGWQKIPIGFSDSVYLTMEMSRGDTTDGFGLSRILALDDSFYDQNPLIDNSSYKKSSPNVWQPSTLSSEIPIKVSVIPNPFNNSAQISVDIQQDYPLNITLFDPLGRKVQELTNGMVSQAHSEYTLSSQTLSSGFYYLRVQSGSQVATRKIELLK